MSGFVGSRHYSASGVTIRGAFPAVIVKSKRTAHEIFSFHIVFRCLKAKCSGNKAGC